MSEWQKVLEKYHMDKWFRKENLVIMILVGILLIVIALPTKENKETEAREEQIRQEEIWSGLQEENNTGTGTGSSMKSSTNTEDLNDEAIFTKDTEFADAVKYIEEMEEKLEEILAQIQGIGEVYVMITLQETEEVIVEKDPSQQQEQTIYKTEGSSSAPYVKKTIFPKVEGVVVVAQGAGTGRITQNITEVVQALFDIEVHKIKVAVG